MLTEDNRVKLLELLKRMGIDPEYVSRDGANTEGYRTFVFEPSKRQEDGYRLSRFVPWTQYQLDVIFENPEVFETWFAEAEADEEESTRRLPLQVLMDAYESRGIVWEVETDQPTLFNAITLEPGQEHVVSVRLVMKRNV